jgi:uncharacterized membrane protein
MQATLFFGLVAVVLCGALLVAGGRRSAWVPEDPWLTALTGVVGVAGLMTFYLALERGKASVVIPTIGVYPVVVAVLAVALLGEQLRPPQMVGVGLAVVAIVLLGAGG